MLNRTEKYLLMKEYAEVYGQVLIHAEALKNNEEGAEGLHAVAVYKLDVLDRVTRYTGFKSEDYSKARQAAKYYAKGWDYEHFIEKYTQQNVKTWRPLEDIVAMTKTGTYAEVVDILYAASRLADRDKVDDIVTQLDAIDSEYGVY